MNRAGLLLLIGVNACSIKVPSLFVEEPCANVELRSTQPVVLDSVEKGFVCGDPNVPAWSKIPLREARIHLQAFLEKRGYFDNRFEFKKGKLIANVGHPILISRLSVVDSPLKNLLRPYWMLKVQNLTPGILDNIESAARSRLAQKGYPCAKLQVRASAVTGEVWVQILHAQPMRVIGIEDEPVKGVASGVFDRYRACDIGHWFNADCLDLTTHRIEADGIVEKSDYAVLCSSEDGARIHRTFVVGPPRLFSIGLGADTEEYFILRLQFKAARLGPEASSFRAALLGSYRTQEASLLANWYLKPNSRFFLNPDITARHENEKRFETTSARAAFQGAKTWDTASFGIVGRIGPSYNFEAVQRGAGPSVTSYLSLDGLLTLQSHYFELYQRSPRQGMRLDLNVTAIESELTAPTRALVSRLSGEGLINLGGLRPPLAIIGIRGRLNLTVQPYGGSRKKLPASFRHYLGGIEDLRGFGRKTIPPNAEGALMTSYLGLEVRSGAIPHPRLNLLAFVDFGVVGDRSRWFTPPLYWSPGAGVRWESPIGTFRGTLGYGFVAWAERPDQKQQQGLNIYLSYGEEF